jgi:6-phosphogluconolactonase
MSEMSGRVETLPDPAALAHHVAEWMTAAALAAKDVFRVSLSGGSTPKALFTPLASDAFIGRFPWTRVSWYWGDERFVPYDHPESNYRMTRETMLSKAPVPLANFHPVPADGTPTTRPCAMNGRCRPPPKCDSVGRALPERRSTWLLKWRPNGLALQSW